MTCIRRNLDTQNCCNAWQKGIRTIDGQYPDDNREFKITAGAGILITPITAGILITNSSNALIAGQNIELTPSGSDMIISTIDGPTFNDDTTINGDLNVNGNIYNQGASYESHMEQVYTTDDYIIMRDNAVTGLAAGSYAGFQVKLYDGVNDGRLVMDNSGTARVGDVGDEQPLMTRDESADLTNGNLLQWDGTNQKAIDSGIDSADVITDSYQDTGYLTLPAGLSGQIRKCCIAPNVYLYTFIDVQSTSTGDFTIDTLPASFSSCNARAPALINPNNGSITGTVYIANGQTTVKLRVFTASSYIVGSFVVGY